MIADTFESSIHILFIDLNRFNFGYLFVGLGDGRTRINTLQYLFETVSAFATVGLSTGITTEIGSGAKIVLMVMMFVGRLGPITVATSLKTGEARLKHVEERIFIG